MHIKSGKLDRIITITRLSETVGASGNVSETWTALHTVRAEKVELASAENLESFGNADSGQVVFRIRYLADVTTADRITYDGSEYDIEHITELGRRRGQELRGVLVQ